MLLLLYLAISFKSEYLPMAFLPRTEQRPAFSRLIDKARLTSEVLYPKSLTAKWQIMPLASLTCLFRLAEISDASFRSKWDATVFMGPWGTSICNSVTRYGDDGSWGMDDRNMGFTMKSIFECGMGDVGSSVSLSRRSKFLFLNPG